MKTLTELFQQYAVKMDYATIDSNLVYPMDNFKNKFEFKGYAQESDVTDFLSKAFIYLNATKLTNRIANKYAIPFMQTGYLHRLDTYFYYQHDNKTWVICLTEETDKYLG
jgi:hypothetical protein